MNFKRYDNKRFPICDMKDDFSLSWQLFLRSYVSPIWQ